MKRVLSILAGLAVCVQLQATITVGFSPSAAGIDPSEATILTDTKENATLALVAGLFADDIERVTGTRPALASHDGRKLKTTGDLVIIGTVGQSRLISELAKRGLIDTEPLKGAWERYAVSVIDNPFSGVGKALVIAASDRRGAAYGAFAISKAMGVSPWYWWADVPVAKHDAVRISGSEISSEPGVKLRGIFINDEDWGMFTWSGKNYEKELGDIGPRTYERVCELLLRLRGNMLAPAMHSCTGAFYSHPESKVVADRYAIMITTSHCEPLLFNNASKLEWDKAKDGEWNYVTNGAHIREKLDARVAEAAAYENVYTLAMRGLHDEGMRGDLNDEEKVQNLTNAINDQRTILKKHIKKTPIEKIPQIFVPYKEAMDVYELGLKVPDDVTLVWPDDNYGYLKRLSNAEEQKRSGSAGVYYHLSYCGTPHDYLWLNTTPPVLMYEELKKAWNSGARRYWLLNVGDIKPMELGIQTFFDMAWDIDSFDIKKANKYQAEFLASIFGDAHETEFQHILDNYYRLAWSRKPEYMGFEVQWDRPELADVRDSDFSFENYNDARLRLADYEDIARRTEAIEAKLPAALRPAFFEIMGYQVLASGQMNRKFLLAQYNHEQAAAGNKGAAQWAAIESRAAYDRINALNDRYNRQLDGKWNYMMAVPPGYVSRYQIMPKLNTFEDAEPLWQDLGVQEAQDGLDGCTVIDLSSYSASERLSHKISLVEGIGYDWKSIQLGEAHQESGEGSTVDFLFSSGDASEISVCVYSLPFFPVCKGREARFGVSVDGSDMEIATHAPVEWSKEWKDDVSRNSAIHSFTFHVDGSNPEHKLRITSIDPGQIIQRIVIDWGGLKQSYVGPSSR